MKPEETIFIGLRVDKNDYNLLEDIRQKNRLTMSSLVRMLIFQSPMLLDHKGSKTT